jgi:hypothetical protein
LQNFWGYKNRGSFGGLNKRLNFKREKEFLKSIFVQGKITDTSTKWEGNGKHKIPT